MCSFTQCLPIIVLPKVCWSHFCARWSCVCGVLVSLLCPLVVWLWCASLSRVSVAGWRCWSCGCGVRVSAVCPLQGGGAGRVAVVCESQSCVRWSCGCGVRVSVSCPLQGGGAGRAAVVCESQSYVRCRVAVLAVWLWCASFTHVSVAGWRCWSCRYGVRVSVVCPSQGGGAGRVAVVCESQPCVRCRVAVLVVWLWCASLSRVSIAGWRCWSCGCGVRVSPSCPLQGGGAGRVAVVCESQSRVRCRVAVLVVWLWCASLSRVSIAGWRCWSCGCGVRVSPSCPLQGGGAGRVAVVCESQPCVRCRVAMLVVWLWCAGLSLVSVSGWRCWSCGCGVRVSPSCPLQGGDAGRVAVVCESQSRVRCRVAVLVVWLWCASLSLVSVAEWRCWSCGYGVRVSVSCPLQGGGAGRVAMVCESQSRVRCRVAVLVVSLWCASLSLVSVAGWRCWSCRYGVRVSAVCPLQGGGAGRVAVVCESQSCVRWSCRYGVRVSAVCPLQGGGAGRVAVVCESQSRVRCRVAVLVVSLWCASLSLVSVAGWRCWSCGCGVRVSVACPLQGGGAGRVAVVCESQSRVRCRVAVLVVWLWCASLSLVSVAGWRCWSCGCGVRVSAVCPLQGGGAGRVAVVCESHPRVRFRVAVLVVWLAPCVIDRVRWSEPYVCKWEPSNNPEMVVFVAIVGHHFPCCCLLFCYVRVFLAMRARAAKSTRRVGAGPMATSADESTRVKAIEASVAVPSMSDHTAPALTTTVARLSTHVLPIRTADVNNDDDDLQTVAGTVSVCAGGGQYDVTQTTSSKSTSHSRKRQLNAYARERKTFVTLTYIIFTYLACWVPFHFVFDVSAIWPTAVPESLYTATFWLTYFNSTLNPFLYAFSNKEFRDAFRKVIRCEYCRKS